ncbi:dihydrodipicolinate synthase family protein [Synoicihabitans lomoniglobus]|uniref:Dihydrodipicolinate synthase family protein n=1 Tax=Synoicihabitans lomoniglobus TaxID=2909285 RepID=A0AAF0CGC1_9BACT|nr:dihydrodipicolinate synthase family protein [Opitutaceae bacterium LMO-M01]WED63407.1 dihydrodipicolinate synthase family protein [Opitutaceae bacterium LMO-M01]
MTALPRAGVLAALWIPTDSQGRLDRMALAAHLNWLRTTGVVGVLALGSTGEFPRFSVAQRKTLLAAIAELAAPLPVLANISDLNHRHAIELGQFARELGLPGVTLMPPHFYPLSAADQLAYFLAVADEVQLPTLLYNFPELTGNRIAVETIEAFAQRAPMAGIKHSGREFDYLPTLVDLGRRHDFVVFSGADTRLPEVAAVGAAGCIGGMVNFVPELMVEIFTSCQEGRASDTVDAVRALVEIGQDLDELTFPLNVAAGMQGRGLKWGETKTVVSADSWARFDRIVTTLRQRYDAAGLAAV